MAARAREALSERPNGTLPDWFIASSLLRAVAELGPAPSRRAYEEWRAAHDSKAERMPPSAPAIASRFGSWSEATAAAAIAARRDDATRALVWTLQDRAGR